MQLTITPQDVDRFLEANSFGGYQAVPLPYGRYVPGRDRTPAADLAFRQGVAGKSVLDVGTYYGFLPYEASRRGASRAVGLEPDPERARMARQIAELHGGRYEIVTGRAEDFTTETRFHVVTLLNVLHHVVDPINLLARVSALCCGTLVVEFCTPYDPSYIQYLTADSRRVTLSQKALARARAWLVRAAAQDLPLMAVGNREYDRVFYFTPTAFHNLLVTHLKLATNIEFVPSVDKRRIMAFCTMR